MWSIRFRSFGLVPLFVCDMQPLRVLKNVLGESQLFSWGERTYGHMLQALYFHHHRAFPFPIQFARWHSSVEISWDCTGLPVCRYRSKTV